MNITSASGSELRVLPAPDAPEIRVLPWSRWPEVESAWDELAATSAYSSFFLGKEWTASWLDAYGPVLQPDILIFEARGSVVGACLLVRRTQTWARAVPVRCVYLNTSGEENSESACIEFNNVLCAPGWERPVGGALARYLARLEWDFMAANGCVDSPAIRGLREALPSSYRQSRQSKPSHFVNLRFVHDSGGDYVALLSPNTRSQVRRSQKLYSQKGEISIRAAETIEEAFAMFAELVCLHQRSWQAKGKPGAFQSARFTRFHHLLITRTFSQGGSQLLRVSAGGESVGVLYNFVRDGKVYFYQSGFADAPDNRHKPGLTSHVLAIQYNLDRGRGEYDFLAGDGRYKGSLATESRELQWIRIERPTWRLKTASLLRRMARGVIQARARLTLPSPSGTRTRAAAKR